jgi:hypothetical protein
MFRALTILAAIAALAVVAAPIASAHREPDEAGNITQVRPELMEGAVKARKPPRGTTGVVTNNNDPDKLGKVRAGGARVIEVPA